MNTIQIFQYEKNPVSFRLGDKELMINATEMAKPFGKVTKDWLRTKSTQEFISSLSAVRQICPTDLVRISQGGNGVQGTWMHEDVALEFARWLNPLFAIWCNDRIKELLRFGITATDEMLVKAATDPGFVLAMLSQIKENHEHCRKLENHNAALTKQLEEATPKVAFFDKLQITIESDNERNSYLISKIAYELGMKPAALNAFLHKKGVLVKIDGIWSLTPKYQYEGLTIDREIWGKKMNDDGEIVEGIVPYLSWTSKGRQFIHSLFESK